MIETIAANASVFLIVAVRCFAFLMTMPLFSMRSVSTIVKVALAGYMAYFLMQTINTAPYAQFIGFENNFTLYYVLVLIGEALIGVITGFYISIIFAAFSTAGQFFAFQMGFSASEVYDSLSQVENPLMGQYFNLIAMLVFFQTGAFQVLFFNGLKQSFTSLSAFSFIDYHEPLVKILFSGLTKLFSNALVIALPIMGSLLLVSICMGILSKAAPQMNLLSEGFPIMMLLSFFILTVSLPYICDFFTRSFYAGFIQLERIFGISGGNPL
ncbi:MAG: flagellar biosynthetic protein FliR [Treponema sp.]|uniref:flagellar biosynthetic protein FliR n=1 Tax=Treponema sp. TaxID=166 RepID=UPI001B785031|nr:flagellar biosynthetic protein FliR [Treponema sp.]MBP5402504.1 flagellar biosynthetic protein FliR [Treponema sp.]MBR5933124.1 flagellar biosynthetic protein FliR [Treponema sp.]